MELLVWVLCRVSCGSCYISVSSDLCGLNEEKQKPSATSDVVCCSDQNDNLEMKPHSYLEAICSGLEDPVAGSSCADGEQLCPYAAAGACHFGERCLYLHGDVCEICGLQVLHPFNQEQRKAHEMVTLTWNWCEICFAQCNDLVCLL